jgi:Bacterial conjugation TrbI-like protein
MQNFSDANSELDNDWDEASFAKLLGLNDEKQPENKTEFSETGESLEEVNNQSIASNPIATHELFDDPQLGKTQPTFHGNPFAKFGAVGLVMLVVFGAGATVLNSIMSGTPRIAPTISNQKLSKPKVEITENSESTETGKLKAELALLTQAEKIKSVEHSNSPKTTVRQSKIQPSKELNKRPPSRITSTEIPRNRVTYVPRQIPKSIRYNVSRQIPESIRYNPSPVVSVRQSQPFQKQVNKQINSKQQATDPMEEWVKISRLGSYGSTEIASKTDVPPNRNTIDTAIKEQQTPITPRATLVSSVSNPVVETANNSELEPLHAEEAAIIENQEIQQLTVGISGDAQLVTPLIWGKNPTNNISNNSANKNKLEKFIVQLSKPLTTKDNLVILPKAAQIIVQVTDIQKSGFVQMEATQVVIDGKEYILPAGAISIRGNSGQPLMASKWGDKGGEIATRDVETFAVSSLAKVGKVLNQPKEEQISTNSGLSSINSFSSIRRSRSNILGAVLEGGFEPLTQQILQRNQQALQEIQQRQEVWYVKAGTNVQVFVNQSFQF